YQGRTGCRDPPGGDQTVFERPSPALRLSRSGLDNRFRSSERVTSQAPFSILGNAQVGSLTAGGGKAGCRLSRGRDRPGAVRGHSPWPHPVWVIGPVITRPRSDKGDD